MAFVASTTVTRITSCSNFGTLFGGRVVASKQMMIIKEQNLRKWFNPTVPKVISSNATTLTFQWRLIVQNTSHEAHYETAIKITMQDSHNQPQPDPVVSFPILVSLKRLMSL
jgi:hypothetical protein